MTPTRLNLKYILIGTYDCSESSYLCIKTKIKVQETHCLGFLLNKGDKNKHPPHTPAGGYRMVGMLCRENFSTEVTYPNPHIVGKLIQSWSR